MARDTKLYDTLGIKPGCSEAEIKKAYRHMALKSHPDKNNHSKEATEKFQEITQAYQILSDPDQRCTYDRYGLDGLNGKPNTNPTPHFTSTDLFDQVFGDSFKDSFGGSFGGPFGGPFGGSFGLFNTFNHSNRPRPRQQKKGPDICHKLACTLEDLYKGKKSKLGYHRTELCDACNARGSLNVHKCSHCGGTGRVVVRSQIGPIAQRVESTCSGCNGSGEYIFQNDLCKKCHGAKTVMERRIFTVDVPPGAKDGDSMILDGEGDQGLEIVPGNVVVTIVQKPHNVFKRSGHNLVHHAKIDLVTALTGGSFNLKHLNGTYLNVNISRGELIRPKSLKLIKGYGMPIDKNAFGDLIVHFSIIFPPQLSLESMDLLVRALPREENTTQIPADAPQVPVVLSECLIEDNQDQSSSNNPSNDSQTQRPHKRRKEGNASFSSSDSVQCTSQ